MRRFKLCIKAPLRQVIAGQDPDCVLCAGKVMRFEVHEKGFDVHCRIDLARMASVSTDPGTMSPAQFTVGLEMVINLLAPNVPDRYLEFTGERKPLEWSGVVEGLLQAPRR